MKNLTCAICKTNKHTTVLYKENFQRKNVTSKTFSARRIPDRIHYRFLQCHLCGLIFSNPILPSSTIAKLYKASTFTYASESFYLAQTYWRYLEQILPNVGRKKLRLLDIGCGNGFFLEKAKSMGIANVYGIEPGSSSAKKARADIKKNIRIDILKPRIFKKNSFDVISCFHTLDHIVDPNAFLKIVYNLLKRGGRIIFVTHDTDGLSVKLFGEKSPIFDIEHIYLFNKNTLFKIFSLNGFTDMHIQKLKNTYPLSYWIRITPMPKSIKQILTTVMRFLKLESLPISINAGNIVITARK